MDVYPGTSGWALSAITSVVIRGRQRELRDVHTEEKATSRPEADCSDEATNGQKLEGAGENSSLEPPEGAHCLLTS